MNMAPSNMENYEEVTQEEYEHFINECIRNYTVTHHGGGTNVNDYRNKIVAWRKDLKHFYVSKEFIKNE